MDTIHSAKKMVRGKPRHEGLHISVATMTDAHAAKMKGESSRFLGGLLSPSDISSNIVTRCVVMAKDTRQSRLRGRDEAQLVKKGKKLEKRKSKYSYHVLEGPTYSEEELPGSWSNELPLLCDDYDGMGNPPSMERLPLDQIPLIEDFQVILLDMRDSEGRSVFGYHLYFSSPSRGFIADFPWWDHIEKKLCRENFSLPLGDFAEPFSDLEQGWEIVIAEHDGYVYVLQGQFDQSPIQGYHTWFKVPKLLYLSQWQEAIQKCRSHEGE